MGRRSARKRKAKIGARAAHSIQREISPQVSNVVSMGFFYSCTAPSRAAARFYRVFTVLGVVDREEKAEADVSMCLNASHAHVMLRSVV